MRTTTLASTSLLLMLVIGTIGCGLGDGLDPAAKSLRAKILLTSEPPKPVSLADAREAARSNAEVVVTGRIGAGSSDPWVKDKAAFVISELPTEEESHSHGPDHDPDSCPFCKHKAAKAATAMVYFMDDKGEALPVDARKLFGIKKNQTVVVRGRVEVDEFGAMLVKAESLYVKS